MESGLRDLAKRLKNPHVSEILREEERQIAVELALVYEPFLMGRTPVASSGASAGKLRDSTARDDGQATPDGFIIGIYQPARSARSGVQYGRFVVNPHRIVAWGHDTGRMYPGNPYPGDAMQQAHPMMQRTLTAGVERALARILA
jgi:hypothetical protein